MEHFKSGFRQTCECIPLFSNMFWKYRFKNSFILSVRNQIGCICIVLEYLGFSRIDLNAVPVFDFKGTLRKDIEHRQQKVIFVVKFPKRLDVI